MKLGCPIGGGIHIRIVCSSQGRVSGSRISVAFVSAYPLRITIRGAPRHSELSPDRHPNVIGRQFSLSAGIGALCQHLPRGPACG